MRSESASDEGRIAPLFQRVNPLVSFQGIAKRKRQMRTSSAARDLLVIASF